MKPYLSLTRSWLLQFFRDRQGLFWTFFFPFFFIFMFGSLMGGNSGRKSDKTPIGLVVLDPSRAIAWAPDAVRKNPAFDVRVLPIDTARARLRAGKLRAVVVFPAAMAGNLSARRTTEVRVLFDPTQAVNRQGTLAALQGIVNGMDERLVHPVHLLRARAEPIPVPGVAGPRAIDFLVPGILAMMVAQLGLFTALPILTMREKGTLRRLSATPVSRGALVGSFVTQRLFIVMVQTLSLLLVAETVYHYRPVGSLAALVGTIAVGLLTFVSIGAALTAVAKTQESGMSLVQLVNFPMIFLSGVFFPSDAMPSFVRWVGSVIPLTYLVDATRHLTLASPSAYSLPVDFAVLGAWLVAGLFVAGRFFRWE